jgi:HPt (histidine-containing phosphotransfer) domain-containing protein
MSENAAAKLAARLSELWRTSRPTVLERLTVLHSACESLIRDPANREARTAGREAAHKLSGVLGIFGLPQGSEIAASIEQLLKSELLLTPQDLSALGDSIAHLDAVVASKQG